MRHCPSILSFCYLLAACGFVHAAEKPHFLATFDPAVESIQLEFENQAEPGCFWGPYKVRDALLAEMQDLGIKTSESSLFVLSIVTWGAATDDYHCAVLVETELKKFGVRAETSEDEWIGIDRLNALPGFEEVDTDLVEAVLEEAGVPVVAVSDVTGFPEILGGRVKTLHPRIHGGILADRDDPEHRADLEAHGIDPIDLVVVNLYPFQETVARPDVTQAEAIEKIDVGGRVVLLDLLEDVFESTDHRHLPTRGTTTP